MDNSNQENNDSTSATPTTTTPATPVATPPPALVPNEPPAQTPPPPPASAQNQTPPPANMPSGPKLPLIIVGIFVLILFLVGGYFIFSQVTKTSTEETPVPTTFEVPRGT